jgi:circadian clock protein KaiC
MAVDSRESSERVSTGAPGLDALIGGGFPRDRTVMICGDIGTGKTLFGLQFLMAGAADAQAGLFVTVDEKPRHVIEDAARFGWDIAGARDRQLVTVLGASPAFTAFRGRNGLDARQVASDLTQQVCRIRATRLVIDGATSLVPDGAPAGHVEDFLRSLIHSLEDNLGCTAMLTARTFAGVHQGRLGPACERLASGVIELRASSHRTLLIRKMRGTSTPLQERTFDIVAGRGLVLRPSIAV